MNWKTSLGFSIVGLILAGVFNAVLSYGASHSELPDPSGWVVLLLIIVYAAALFYYAVAVYPTFFKDKPLIRNASTISFLNFFLGGLFFGLLWNRNLTRRVKGVSNTIAAILVALVIVATIGINVVSYVVTKEASEQIAVSNNLVRGDTVYYGNYKGWPIAWHVLGVYNDTAFLISEKDIAQLPYDDNNSKTTWATSFLREWLNDDFIHSAFSKEQLSNIITVNNQNSHDPNSKNAFEGGIDTSDKVFVLSCDETIGFFNSTELQIDRSYDLTSQWWLRTPGNDNSSEDYVMVFSGIVENTPGLIYTIDANPISPRSVRPALILNLTPNS